MKFCLTVHLLQLVILFPIICSSRKSNEELGICPPLVAHRNVQLSCSGKKSINSCNRAQISGTIAKYACKPNHIPFDEADREGHNKLKCENTGEWSGITRYEGFRCKEDCGRIVTNARPLVIHGVPANRTQWPWHAAIFRKSGNTWNYICGGSIIRNQIVLSAAHCFAVDHNRVKNPEEFRIILGSISSKFVENLNEEGVQIHAVQSIRISGSYDPRKGFQGDIAVIELKENVDFNENVVPVCLPNDYTTDVNALKPGMLAQVAGYGITEEGSLSRTLRALDLYIKSNSECYSSLQRILSESQFCGGNKLDRKWETVCNGDSGGGLVVLSAVHQKYYIHGIVSSGGADRDHAVCKSFGVFTRVYSSVFWIRDVIEEISGEIAKDLLQNPSYPYALRGTETKRGVFLSLPREWNRRVTSLEISHAEFRAETLLDALENAKPIEKIELLNVLLLNGTYFQRQIILPVLSNFTFDLLPSKKEFEQLDQGRTFPLPITQEYLRKLIFFGKEFDSGDDWNVATLLDMGTDIELTVHIFRLLRISVSEGVLVLQQTQLANEIIESTMEDSEFILQKLALHRTELEIFKVGAISTLTELILDKVRLTTPVTNLSPVLTNLTELKYLVLNLQSIGGKMFNLDLHLLSNELGHLSLTNFKVGTTTSSSFKNLRKFCCFYCEFEKEFTTNEAKLFPNMTTLVLKMKPNQRFPNFDSPLLTSIYIELPKLSEKFSRHLSNLYQVNGNLNFSRIYLRRMSGNSTWASRIPTESERRHLEYSCNAQSRFWTSEEDFMSLRRLKTFEKAALNSHHYNFEGATNSLSPEEFTAIPQSIQSGLVSIHLSLVEVTPKVLAESIAHSPKLKSLTLSNVLLDIGSYKYTLIRNHSLEFRLEEAQFKGFTFQYVLEYVDGKFVAAVIPFQLIGRFGESNSSNVLHRLFHQVNSVRLTADDKCIFYYMDNTHGEANAFMKFTIRVISALPQDHILKGMKPAIQRISDTAKEGVFPNSMMFNGLHVITQELLDEYFNDAYIRVLGPTGIIHYITLKFAKFVTLEKSTSITLAPNKNPLNFPSIQAIAANLNEEKVE